MAATPSKPKPTTTTTTTPSKNAQAFAKLVIKPASVGHVSVKTANGSTFKLAKNGQSLHVGDTVQTDATGQAEIDYADSAYTRLDVNTTFTIKKLTDAQGNRQVDGSLDVGRTYNRTAALTQSQTFQQDGGGATAAVTGTAFVVTCTSATSCTFTAVVDTINLTGSGGQTKSLNPLDECIDNSGALCGTTTRLTPDELALLDWIQTNVYLDLAEHGIGTGTFQPFTNTVVVSAGAVVSPPTDNDLAIGTVPNQTATATSAAGAPVTFTKPTATDESAETPAVGCDHNSGDTFPVGTTTVTCTATDGDDTNGPVHSTFTVTVTDSDLTIDPASDPPTVASTSSAGAPVTFPLPTAHDEGGQHPPVTCDHNSGDTFAIGTTLVTCTATDADDANSPVHTTFHVTVTDSDLAITTPGNVSHGAPTDDSDFVIVTYTPPTATDEGTETPAPLCNHHSGESFPEGTTTVTCTATDNDDLNSPVVVAFNVTVATDPDACESPCAEAATIRTTTIAAADTIVTTTTTTNTTTTTTSTTTSTPTTTTTSTPKTTTTG